MSEMKPCPVADELERRAGSALIGANHPRAEGVAGILFRERATALREAAALVRQSSPATAREVEELRAKLEQVKGLVAKLYCASGCSCCRDDEGWYAASAALGDLLGAPRYEDEDESGVDWYAVRDAALASKGEAA